MILQASDLHAGYGRIPVLHGIDLELFEGECLGIWGNNGMGKSTLLHALQGHLPATSGQIQLAGRDVTGQPAFKRARAGLGLVPQGRQIFPGLTVWENLVMGTAELANGSTQATDEILELFPRLKGLLNRTGGLLSGGEQQLLALARCLCGGPKIMMLDEPTEGIQPSINEEILETLKHLRTTKRLSLILVEQRRDFIAALADRVVILQKGTVRTQVTPAELLDMADIQ